MIKDKDEVGKRLVIWEEKAVVVKSEGTTIRIFPDKLDEAMNRIVKDEKLRARLEMKPADTMAEMGIYVDDREKANLAGKRLSEAMAQMSESDREAMLIAVPGVVVGPVPAPVNSPVVVVQVGVRVGVRVATGVLSIATEEAEIERQKKEG